MENELMERLCYLLNLPLPEIRHPVIGGKNVTVAPLKVRQIPPFARAVQPAAASLMAGDLAGALARHGEALIEAIAVATGEPADWLGELEADEFMLLVGEVVGVNADFFGRRVMPQLNLTLSKLTATLGATPSPSWPAPASPSGTPST